MVGMICFLAPCRAGYLGEKIMPKHKKVHKFDLVEPLFPAFTIALWIAIGLIIVGVIVSFWPVKNDGILGLAPLFQVIQGMIFVVPGIVLLLVLALANSKQGTMEIIAVILGLVSALFILGSMLTYLPNFVTFGVPLNGVNDKFVFGLFIGVVGMLGFLSAGYLAIQRQHK